MGNCYMTQGTQTRALEGWDGLGGGMEVQEGGAVGTPMTDSCWCMAEYYNAIILQLKWTTNNKTFSLNAKQQKQNKTKQNKKQL